MGKKQSLRTRRRWSILTGVLAAGAVAGTVGAIMMRRRAQPDWDSYDSGQVLDTVREDAEAIVNSSSDGHHEAPKISIGEKAKNAAAEKASMAEKAMEQVITGERRPSTTSAITESAKQTAAKGTNKPDGLLGSNPPATSRNSRS